jgi:hypothetical protein
MARRLFARQFSAGFRSGDDFFHDLWRNEDEVFEELAHMTELLGGEAHMSESSGRTPSASAGIPPGCHHFRIPTWYAPGRSHAAVAAAL